MVGRVSGRSIGDQIFQQVLIFSPVDLVHFHRHRDRATQIVGYNFSLLTTSETGTSNGVTLTFLGGVSTRSLAGVVTLILLNKAGRDFFCPNIWTRRAPIFAL